MLFQMQIRLPLPNHAMSVSPESYRLTQTECFSVEVSRGDHPPLDFGWLKKLTLRAVEPIAEAQPDGSGTTHRYAFVPLPVVRIQLRPRVGQVLSVDLHEPRVFCDTERAVVGCERRQIISSRVALLMSDDVRHGRKSLHPMSNRSAD